jgi:hypothetical protein
VVLLLQTGTNGTLWYILGVNFALTFYPIDVATVAILMCVPFCFLPSFLPVFPAFLLAVSSPLYFSFFVLRDSPVSRFSPPRVSRLPSLPLASGDKTAPPLSALAGNGVIVLWRDQRDTYAPAADLRPCGRVPLFGAVVCHRCFIVFALTLSLLCLWL